MAEPTADYVDLFMRAAASGGIYTGIFRHEVVQQLLRILDEAIDHCLAVFQYVIETRRSHGNHLQMLIDSVDTMHSWDSRVVDEEVTRLREQHAKLDIRYRSTIMLYLQETLKDQYAGGRIQFTVPRFGDFYHCFLGAYADHSFVRSGGYFDNTRYLERKLTQMDALRSALDQCVMNNVVILNEVPSRTSTIPKQFTAVQHYDSVSNPDQTWNDRPESRHAPVVHEPPQRRSPVSSAVKSTPQNRPVLEPPKQQPTPRVPSRQPASKPAVAAPSRSVPSPPQKTAQTDSRMPLKRTESAPAPHQVMPSIFSQEVNKRMTSAEEETQPEVLQITPNKPSFGLFEKLKATDPPVPEEQPAPPVEPSEPKQDIKSLYLAGGQKKNLARKETTAMPEQESPEQSVEQSEQTWEGEPQMGCYSQTDSSIPAEESHQDYYAEYPYTDEDLEDEEEYYDDEVEYPYAGYAYDQAFGPLGQQHGPPIAYPTE